MWGRRMHADPNFQFAFGATSGLRPHMHVAKVYFELPLFKHCLLRFYTLLGVTSTGFLSAASPQLHTPLPPHVPLRLSPIAKWPVASYVAVYCAPRYKTSATCLNFRSKSPDEYCPDEPVRTCIVQWPPVIASQGHVRPSGLSPLKYFASQFCVVLACDALVIMKETYDALASSGYDDGCAVRFRGP